MSSEVHTRLLPTSWCHQDLVSTIFSHSAPSVRRHIVGRCHSVYLSPLWQGVCVCVVFVRKRCRNWTGGWRTSTVSWGSLSWAGSTWRSPTRSCWASHRYFFSTALGEGVGGHGFQVGLKRKEHCSFYDVQAQHLYPLLVLAEEGEDHHTWKRSPTPLLLWSEPAP